MVMTKPRIRKMPSCLSLWECFTHPCGHHHTGLTPEHAYEFWKSAQVTTEQLVHLLGITLPAQDTRNDT